MTLECNLRVHFVNSRDIRLYAEDIVAKVKSTTYMRRHNYNSDRERNTYYVGVKVTVGLEQVRKPIIISYII